MEICPEVCFMSGTFRCFYASKVAHLSVLNIEFKITFEDIIPLTSLFSIVMYTIP